MQVSLLCYNCKLQVENIYETDTWLAEGDVELVTNKLPFDNLKKMKKIVIIYHFNTYLTNNPIEAYTFF